MGANLNPLSRQLGESTGRCECWRRGFGVRLSAMVGKTVGTGTCLKKTSVEQIAQVRTDVSSGRKTSKLM